MFEFKIDLEKLEQLESKYNVEIFVEKHEGYPDAYYIVKEKGLEYIGSTIYEIEESLEGLYGNTNIQNN